MPLERWHASAPIEALALYRVGFGLLLALESAAALPHAVELYSSQGFHLGPLAAWAPSPAAAVTLAALLTLSCLAFAAGFFTRLSLVVTMALWGFLHNVDLINEKAVHMLALVIMAILLFSRCGDRLSLDDRLARRAGARTPALACAFPWRLLQLQFAQIYFFSGLRKLADPAWPAGDALARSLHSRWATELGVALSSLLPGAFFQAGALAALGFELCVVWLLFPARSRPWAIACGLVFHVLIQSTLRVGTLGPHFILALLLLFPDAEAVVGRLRAVRALLGVEDPGEA